MRICMYHHYYLPFFSGAAIRSHQQARIALHWGHEVRVLTPCYPGLSNQEVLDGIPVIRARTFGRTRMQRFLTFALSASWELLLRRDKYDLVHFFSLSAFEALPLAVAKALGKRVLYQMTMMPPKTNRLGGRQAVLIRGLLHLVDGAIVLSTPMLHVLQSAGFRARPLTLIPNGVDVKEFYPVQLSDKVQMRRRLGLEPKAKFVCFVGTVEERKGVDILIEAFAVVAAKCPEVRLLLVGRDDFINAGFEADIGYHRAQAFVDMIKHRVQELELAGHVVFTGHVEPDKVSAYLQASDLFVLPSRREGFPSVVIQAMATGLPCIVADMEGVAADIITSGVDGYIVNGYNPASYAECMLYLLAHPAEAERIGQAARRTVEQRFRIEYVVEQYLAFCEALLGS
jgi:glycosyltransferase involved in cell wall biosynthesis